jgi:hypothetical protein
MTSTIDETTLVSWHKQPNREALGGDRFRADFPMLYGTHVAISTFPEQRVIDLGPVLVKDAAARDFLAMKDYGNHRRIYAVPGTMATAKLSLNCCFENDCGDWDAQSGYFDSKGDLVAVVSLMSIDEKERGQQLANTYENNSFKPRDLLSIYQEEVNRVAKARIGYTGNLDPCVELVKILKADSPRGMGLHDSYREAVRGLLKPQARD